MNTLTIFTFTTPTLPLQILTSRHCMYYPKLFYRYLDGANNPPHHFTHPTFSKANKNIFLIYEPKQHCKKESDGPTPKRQLCKADGLFMGWRCSGNWQHSSPLRHAPPLPLLSFSSSPVLVWFVRSFCLFCSGIVFHIFNQYRFLFSFLYFVVSFLYIFVIFIPGKFNEKQ